MLKKMIFILLFFVILSSCFSEKEIRLLVLEHPPYFYLEDGIWKGISFELSELLLKEAGYSIVERNLPWKRGIVDIKNGRIDMMTNLSITEERKGFLHFIGPQMDESMVLVVSKDSEYNINQLDDIKKIPGKIGIQLGVFYGDNFDKKLKTDKEFRDKFIIINDGNLFARLFNSGRLNGFITVKYEFYYRQKLNEEYKNLKEHSFIINQNYIYFGFSKKSFKEKEMTIFQEAYDTVEARGSFKEVLDLYSFSSSN